MRNMAFIARMTGSGAHARLRRLVHPPDGRTGQAPGTRVACREQPAAADSESGRGGGRHLRCRWLMTTGSVRRPGKSSRSVSGSTPFCSPNNGGARPPIKCPERPAIMKTSCPSSRASSSTCSRQPTSCRPTPKFCSERPHRRRQPCAGRVQRVRRRAPRGAGVAARRRRTFPGRRRRCRDPGQRRISQPPDRTDSVSPHDAPGPPRRCCSCPRGS